jgi:hypothetical protein
MKLLLKKILLFAIIWFAMAFVLDYYLSIRIRHSKFREYRIWEDIFNSRITSDMIVLGSSRTYDHYNPIIFESILNNDFYNLGLDGKKIDMDIFRYHQYKKYHNRQPRYIIWDIYHRSFAKSNGYSDEQFMGYIWDDDIWQEIHSRENNVNWFDRTIPLLRYWRRNMIRTYPDAVMDVYKGYVKYCPSFDGTELRRTKDHSIDCCYDSTIINSFRQTVKEMQNDGSKVILIYSPFYYQGQQKVKNLDLFISFVQEMAEQENCLFMNYLNDTINYDTSLFMNASHLNGYGADVFSAKLAHDLDSILNSNCSFGS